MAKKQDNSALDKPAQATTVERDPTNASTYRILNRTQEEVEKAMRIFQQNLRGQKLTDRDMPRVTIPAQGLTIWTIPGTEQDEHHEELTGILAEYTTPRAYWRKPIEPGNTTPPTCSSPDGIKGYGDPGGDCYSCPFNKFGTALGEGQSGKACKEKRMLFLLQPRNILPLAVQGPSTSIPAIKKYMVALSNEETPFHAVYTRLTLEKVPAGGLSYSRIVPRALGPVSEGHLPQIEAYQAAFAGILGTHQVGIVPDTENMVTPGAGEAMDGSAAGNAGPEGNGKPEGVQE